jgi:hypothetical protein
MAISKTLLRAIVIVLLAISLVYAEESGSLYDNLNERYSHSYQTAQLGQSPVKQTECPAMVSIALKVIDADSAEIVPNLIIELIPYTACARKLGEIKDGVHSVNVPRDSLSKLSLQAAKYEPGLFKFDLNNFDEQTKNKIIQGQNQPFVIKLFLAQGIVRGRVLDANTKKPIKNVSIGVGASLKKPPFAEFDYKELPFSDDDRDCGDIFVSGRTTEEDGSFILNNLRLKPAGIYTTLHFYIGGYDSKDVSIMRGHWKEDLGDVLLLRYASLKGVLFDKNKQPIVKKELWLLTPEEFKDGSILKSTKRSITNAQGSFMFNEISPKEYVIVYGSSESDNQQLSFASGENKTVTLIRQ